MTFCQKGRTMECLGFSDRELSQWAVQQAAISIARAHGLRSDEGVMAYVLGPDAGFGEEPVLYIEGRPGWRRVIRRLGIEIDRDGFVAGWQEALRNG
jgi:hypothetical protein